MEADYELLLTNRLILRPLFKVDLYGKSNPARGVGAGVSQSEVGLRMRYEFRREVAPYLGVLWSHAFGETADLAEAAGEEVDGVRFVAGLRLWF